MLNPFPIQFLSLFAYLFLRVVVGSLLITLGVSHIRNHKTLSEVLPFGVFFTFLIATAELVFGVMFILGFSTQYAALGTIVLGTLLLIMNREKTKKHLPSKMFLVLLIGSALSLFVTGAGLPAFDLPL